MDGLDDVRPKSLPLREENRMKRNGSIKVVVLYRALLVPLIEQVEFVEMVMHFHWKERQRNLKNTDGSSLRPSFSVGVEPGFKNFQLRKTEPTATTRKIPLSYNFLSM